MVQRVNFIRYSRTQTHLRCLILSTYEPSDLVVFVILLIRPLLAPAADWDISMQKKMGRTDTVRSAGSRLCSEKMLQARQAKDAAPLRFVTRCCQIPLLNNRTRGRYIDKSGVRQSIQSAGSSLFLPNVLSSCLVSPAFPPSRIAISNPAVR